MDLARLAGLTGAAALAEVVGDDGEPLRLQGLAMFARAHGLAMISIADLIAYRLETERAHSERDALCARHFRAGSPATHSGHVHDR